jgi:tetratricopeptide (TPR) repeat protein
MARDDWFRRKTWTDGDSKDFFARLHRCRTPFHKAQYLRIQALTLAEADKESLLAPALALLQKLFSEFPDSSQLASAHLQAARCYDRLGDSPESIKHFRLSLDAHARFPNMDPGTALEFPWFIVERKITSLYTEALTILDSAHQAFPVQYFKSAAIRAFVAESQNDIPTAARYAREAIEVSGTTRSQFRYHQSLGLVGKEYASHIKRLDRIAAQQTVPEDAFKATRL